MIWDGNEAVYPSNTIINDAVNRAAYSKDAYSPITNEISSIIDEFRVKREDALMHIKDWSHFCESMKEKDYSLTNAKVKWIDVIDETTGTIYTEDDLKIFPQIIIDDIVTYFKYIFNRWQFQHACYVSESSERVQAARQQHDNSGDDYYVTPDELEVEDEFSETFSEEAKIDAVQRLIYYMKLLQELSIAKGYDALQVIILGVRYGGNQSMIARAGIHTIDGTTGKVKYSLSETAYTTTKVADFIKLCMRYDVTSNESKRWGPVISNFYNVVNELGIDLAKEDENFYTADYIDSKLSTYLASTEEYVDTIGRIDKELLSLLEPDKLFLVRQGTVGFNAIFENTAQSDPLVESYTMSRDLAIFDEESTLITNPSKKEVEKRYEALGTSNDDLVYNFVTVIYLVSTNIQEGQKDASGNIITDVRKYAYDIVSTRYYFTGNCILCSDKEDGARPLKIRSETIRKVWPSCPDFGECYVGVSGALVFMDAKTLSPSYITIKELLDEKRKVEIKKL